MAAAAAHLLADKLSSTLARKFMEEASLVMTFKAEFESIYYELAHIKFLLEDAGDKTKYQSMNNWLRNLRDVLTDTTDLVEECEEAENDAVDLAQQREEAGNFVVSLFRHPMGRKFIFPILIGRKFVFQYLMGRRIKELKKRINDINSTSSKYLTYLKSFVDVNASSEDETRKSSSRLDNEDQTVGIQQDIDRISKLISDKDGPRVIAIVGMAGQGKTRLLQHVLKSQEVQSAFRHCTVWLSVSRRFKVEHLLLNIADQIKLPGDEVAIKDPEDDHRKLTIQLPNDYNQLNEVSIERLRARIHSYLQGDGESNVEKSYLFVLDDVWHEDILQQIGVGQNTKNKIVVTTRNRGVSNAMGAIYTHQMECLSDKDSLKLFCTHAFPDLGEKKLPDDLQDLRERILLNCTRLPMAVEAIAKSMVGVSRIYNQWESALLQLDREDFVRLEKFPPLQDMSMLKYLIIRNCDSLKHMPEGLERLKNLEEMELDISMSENFKKEHPQIYPGDKVMIKFHGHEVMIKFNDYSVEVKDDKLKTTTASDQPNPLVSSQTNICCFGNFCHTV